MKTYGDLGFLQDGYSSNQQRQSSGGKYSKEVVEQNEKETTGTDVLTENIEVGVREHVAMFVAGVALQHLCIGLGHVLVTDVVVGNDASPIWRQLCQPA